MLTLSYEPYDMKLILGSAQSVGGYFIRAVNLPRFWYYWAHFIDYQTYAFDLLVFNDFHGIKLACETLADGSCFCDYPSSLVSQGECALAGDDVLQVRSSLPLRRCPTDSFPKRHLASEASAFHCML